MREGREGGKEGREKGRKGGRKESLGLVYNSIWNLFYISNIRIQACQKTLKQFNSCLWLEGEWVSPPQNMPKIIFGMRIILSLSRSMSRGNKVVPGETGKVSRLKNKMRMENNRSAHLRIKA